MDKTTRDVHVLFVHGVGQHSRLSALLQAYQSLRADPRSSEVPSREENPIPEWRLEEFVDASGQGATPRLKLTNDAGNAVHLYEVNYSSLAGVVRGNQPLDLTALFVGFDLAVSVARVRLEQQPPARTGIDHVALARTLQKLCGVIVAATVPVLGIPSLVFRRFTHNWVAVFTRFFEDIATFALDTNGSALINAHFDRTVKSIVESPPFDRDLEAGHRDEFLIAAHSLGSVVAHNYLVRHLSGKNALRRPDKLLTYGSPIGLVCWLWLLVDFEAIDFRRPNPTGYFSWQSVQLTSPGTGTAPMLWINVLNHLDPIATAFPEAYMALSRTPQHNRAGLEGQRIHHRFIDTGDLPGAAHTAYFGDRDGFIDLLARMAGLRKGAPLDVPHLADRSAAQHWRHAAAALLWLRWLAWGAGLVLIAAYLGAAAWLLDSKWALWMLPLFCVPAWTLGSLAFFQRLIFSKPTKRTSIQAIESLPWRDPSCRPHRMRQQWRAGLGAPWPEARERAFVLAPGPGFWRKLWLSVLSFVPTLVALLLPLLAMYAASPNRPIGAQRLADNPLSIFSGALALFTGYLMAFAFSEFARHWREALRIATTSDAASPGAGADNPGSPAPTQPPG